MKRFIDNISIKSVLAADVLLIVTAYLLSYMTHFDFRMPSESTVLFKQTVVGILVFKLLIFYLFHFYKVVWRHTGMVDLFNTIKANVTASLCIITTVLIVGQFRDLPVGIFIIDAFICIMFIGGTRALIRLAFLNATQKGYYNPEDLMQRPAKKIVIIGAGEAGEKILRELRDSPRFTHYRVIGFIDDDPKKLGHNIHGVSVLGKITKLEEIHTDYEIDEAIIAIPSASGKAMRRIIGICEKSGVSFRSIPVIQDILKGKVSISHLRDVTYEDLLGREPVVLETDRIKQYLAGQKILITGAGGSIGSELCRQVSCFHPECIILCDNNEYNLYRIDMDLTQEFPEVSVYPELSDIKNLSQMEELFKKYRPDVVFHAAAYKHVPLMEMNPWGAVHNNIAGTHNVLAVAGKNAVESFVMVSTDKAVRPSNIMGASKRVAEILTQSYAGKFPSTRFMSVRFGNVVGSNGSVIPLFMEQIKNGGPLTVTDPEITRYFMTIPEAAQLILQAGGMGKEGEIFILDMGVPIKIVDIARDIIRLSGLNPDEDIEIKFIGLRPGEKMYEELITEGEGIIKSSHEKIMVLKGEDVQIDDFNGHIDELMTYADKYEIANIIKKMKEIVPEYQPDIRSNTTNQESEKV